MCVSAFAPARLLSCSIFRCTAHQLLSSRLQLHLARSPRAGLCITSMFMSIFDLFDLFRSSSIFLPGSRMVPPSHHDPRPRQTTSHSCGHLDYFSLCWFRPFYCSHVRKVIRGRWSWPVLHTEKRFFSNFPEPANCPVCVGMVNIRARSRGHNFYDRSTVKIQCVVSSLAFTVVF